MKATNQWMKRGGFETWLTARLRKIPRSAGKSHGEATGRRRIAGTPRGSGQESSAAICWREMGSYLLKSTRTTLSGMLRVLPGSSAFACALILAIAGAACSTPPAATPSGLWDAVIVANNAEVPFRFEIAQHDRDVDGFFFEGDRKVGSTSGSFEGGMLRFDYDFLNTTLEATLDGDELRGTYRNRRAGARPQVFRAQRFAPVPLTETEVPRVEGNWVMYRTADDGSKLDVSWRLYLRQTGPEVSGAILRTSGDTGTLVGHWKDGRLVMSHFAGERPLLFEAQPNADGTLAVTLDRKSTYVAARTNEARAKGIPEPPDLSRFTSVADPTERFHFSGPDIDGKMVKDSDPVFQGRVVVLTIGGTWCPNCHDEFPFLGELYKAFHASGLEIVGLFFENDATPAIARPRILAFTRRYAVEFPILVPGINQDNEIARTLPQLVNFAVYPTTIFLGRDGRVRRVHAGFASAATGEEHVKLKQEERDLIERLLQEPAQ
jgi:thiol-disulfide isomerase/thioredoxin